jgi:alginate O-acetyltransferase complex protein AlgI
MTNFKRPIFARSTAEFWQRWHISLSTWFKDYLYFPMGGNRVPLPRWYFNMFIVFLISGLWHGANWTFILWGIINGVYVVFGIATKKQREKINKVTGLDKYPALLTFIQITTVFVLIALVRVFFRAETVEKGFAILKKIFTFSGSVWSESVSMMLLCFSAIAVLLVVELKTEFYKGSFSLMNNQNQLVRKLSCAALIILILLFGVYDGGQFIYFQF